MKCVRKNKLNAKKIEIDGIVFASTKEGKRYQKLKQMQENGEIHNLELQKKYLLIPEHREPDTIGVRGGVKKGKVIERACYYIADFVYTLDETGEEIVEDVKGYRDAQSATYAKFRIKSKLMYHLYGIRIKEV